MIYRHRPQFFAALRRAVGRKEPYPPLSRWARKTVPLVMAVYAAADAQHIDEADRRALRLRVDRRDVSMETILATILHYAAREFPYLLGEKVRDNLTAVYAINLNNRYLMLRLCEEDSLMTGDLGVRLTVLREHLDGIPPTPD